MDLLIDVMNGVTAYSGKTQQDGWSGSSGFNCLEPVTGLSDSVRGELEDVCPSVSQEVACLMPGVCFSGKSCQEGGKQKTSRRPISFGFSVERSVDLFRRFHSVETWGRL